MTSSRKHPDAFVLIGVIGAAVMVASRAEAMQDMSGVQQRARAQVVSQGCRTRTDPLPSVPRQRSIDLARAAGFTRGVTGRVLLTWAPSPFGVSVSRDGHLEYNLTVVVEGLPAPHTLGP